jgi:hypothetical protein
VTGDHEQPTIHQVITVSGHGTVYAVGSGSLNLTVQDDPHNPMARQLVESFEQSSRQRLLQGMSAGVDGRRRHSVRSTAESRYRRSLLLPTDFRYAPDLVNARLLRPWEAAGGSIDTGSVQEVADAADGLLVIGGGAGAGKSTLLDELALRLTADAAAPVSAGVICQLPVRLPVASRYESAQFAGVVPESLADWIGRQTEVDYGVNASIVQAWLRTGQLYLLLDDMSALSFEQRTWFVEELIQLRRAWPVNRVVLATRSDDLASLPVRLPFRAVQISALGPEDVAGVLAALGEPAAGLREAHSRSAAVRELMRSPLVVAAAALGFHGTGADEVRAVLGADEGEGDVEIEALQDRVIDRYVEQLLTAQDVRHDFDPLVTRYFAASLADLMAGVGSAFVVDIVDPRWIARRTTRWLARYGGRTGGYLFCGLASAACGYMIGGPLIAAVQAVFVLLLLRLTVLGPSGPHDPYRTMRRATFETQRVFLGARILDHPLRLLALTLEGLGVVYLTVRAVQAGSDRAAWIWAATFTAAAAWLCYLLMTKEVARVRPDEYDDFGSSRDEPSASQSVAQVVVFSFALSVLNGVGWLVMALMAEWSLHLPTTRGRIDAFVATGARAADDPLGAFVRYLDGAFNDAPLGRFYPGNGWPWLCGLLGTAVGIAVAVTLVAVVWVAVHTSKSALGSELRLPADYRGFLHHLVRTTIMRREHGRFTFTHPLVQGYFRRQWPSMVAGSRDPT